MNWRRWLITWHVWGKNKRRCLQALSSVHHQIGALLIPNMRSANTSSDSLSSRPRALASNWCACPQDVASADVPRRGFLTGLLAVGALGATQSLPSWAQGTKPERIDTHHHLFSPAYVAALAKVNQAPPIVRNWSVAKTLDDMQKAGVATSILSVTTPQVGFANSPEEANAIARESNEWVAQLARDNPGRFGSFAMLRSDWRLRGAVRNRPRAVLYFVGSAGRREEGARPGPAHTAGRLYETN